MQLNSLSNDISVSIINSKPTTARFVSNGEFSSVLQQLQNDTFSSPTDKTDVDKKITMHTNHGNVGIDLDDYLTPKPGTIYLKDIPLLLPTEHNLNTLTQFTQQKVQELLTNYDLPSAPPTIKFDQEGQILLPNDYPYKVAFERALRENPIVLKALSTTTALASHYAAFVERQPFSDEMTTARNDADRARIVKKYSYLFDQNHPAKQVILHFLADGRLLVGYKNT